MRQSSYKNRNQTRNLVTAGVCLALTQVLPMFFHAFGAGTVFLPMHIPVLLCGLLVGPYWGLLVGILAPLIASFLGGPPLYPVAISMAVELGAYGFFAGYFHQKKKLNIYISLILSMLLGRLVYGAVNFVLFWLMGISYGIEPFLLSAFVNCWPGILLQLLIIPPIVWAVEKNTRWPS